MKIPNILKIFASAKLDESIEAELKVPDPEPEKAAAALDENESE